LPGGDGERTGLDKGRHSIIRAKDDHPGTSPIRHI
jgi:hypothetical protein